MKTGGEAREARGARGARGTRGARGAWGLQGEGPRSWKSRKECSETLANSYFETYKSYDHIQIMRIISRKIMRRTTTSERNKL